VPIARRDGLVRVLGRRFSLALDTWIVMHEDLRNSARCRVTFEALAEGLRAHLAQGAGASDSDGSRQVRP